MNIFEEIVESYTYNGAVSLKALEDDIVTLENQIDSYNATLKEVQMRGKKSLPLVQKIRDAKMRLSLLKAVYRRESDKATPDDVIINMLGLSAKNAKETEAPETAADKKEPVPQNFEKAEIEIVDDVEETGAVENEDTSDDEVAVETLDNESDKFERVNVENVQSEEQTTGPATESCEENDADSVASENVKDSEDISIESPDNGGNDVGIEKFKIADDTYDLTKASNEELTEFFSSLTSADSVFVTDSTTYAAEKENETPENETEVIESVDTENKNMSVVEHVCDEPEKNVAIEKLKINADFAGISEEAKEMIEYYNNMRTDEEIFVPDDGQVIEKELVPPENDCPPPTIDDYLEPVDGVSLVDMVEPTEDIPTEAITHREDEMNEVKTFDGVTQDFDMEFNSYEAFPDEKVGIVASLDLCDVTNMVNTMYVYGNINSEKRLLNVRFMDVRDYEVFVGLLKEREETRHKLFGYFGKKPRSIFMYVTASVGEYKQEYVYEFTNCRVASVSDTEYASKACNEIPFEDCSYHNCYVTFKYKKLKINKK